MPFRTDVPFDKIAISLIAANGDRSQKLEFLCDGQQCVVHGVHPGTAKPYVWFGKSLADIPRDELPYITGEQAWQLIEDCAELLVSEHGYAIGSRHKKTNDGTGEGHAHAELVRRILGGENFHDALTSLAWRLVGAGTPGGQAVEFLRGIMLSTPE